MSSQEDPGPTDQELVAAAQVGCVRAFELLVERYQTRLLRFLTRQLDDREMAADLTQQTFLDAFRRLDALRDDRPFAAWLYRIARNNLLAEWRRGLHHPGSLDDLLDSPGMPVSAVQVSDGVTSTCERELVRQVLDALSPVLREALLLNSLCGFPSREVARTLGITPATARQRIARAKEQFRMQYIVLNGSD